MPRGKKRDVENNNSITSLMVRDMGEDSRPEEVLVSDSEELPLRMVKDTLLREFSKATGELKRFTAGVYLRNLVFFCHMETMGNPAGVDDWTTFSHVQSTIEPIELHLGLRFTSLALF